MIEKKNICERNGLKARGCLVMNSFLEAFMKILLQCKIS